MKEGTNFVNKYIIEANGADYTVFVSTWLKNLYVQGMNAKNKQVLLAGASKDILIQKIKLFGEMMKKLK